MACHTVDKYSRKPSPSRCRIQSGSVLPSRRQAGQNGLSGSVARARESQGTVQRNAEMIRVRMSLAEA